MDAEGGDVELEADSTTETSATALPDEPSDRADGKAFLERGEGDRHQFRFIVSPDDAEELSDLKAFTRDLMGQAQADLGTRLDWVAVDHWNTGHPHLHVIVRGRTDEGAGYLDLFAQMRRTVVLAIKHLENVRFLYCF